MVMLTRVLTLLVVTMLLLSSCLLFSDADNMGSRVSSEDKVYALSSVYSSNLYKDEIMRFFAYNGVRVQESSIKRVANWLGGARFEPPV